MTRCVRLCICLAIWILGMRPTSADALSGNQWKQLNEGQRAGYIIGVVDAWTNILQLANISKSQGTSVSEELILANVECVREKMTYQQIIAIVDKYMQDHPESWHFHMASTVWTAIAEACKVVKK